MPWQEQSTLSLRADFISLAVQSGSNISELCHRFNISRKTGYKWLQRYRQQGLPGLLDQSHRPHRSPGRIADDALIDRILHWRTRTGWGGRKIRAVLSGEGWQPLPAASTISEILKRKGCIGPYEGKTHKYKRFEAACPNDLWQMDFKGHIRMRDGICEPLSVLDDCSRFSLGLRTCVDKLGTTVKRHLTDIFRTYGMPWRILADNGVPWGMYSLRTGKCITKIEVWLMSLDIKLSSSRPYHPQTCGKVERFHRTLKRELTGKVMNCTCNESQRLFDDWRHQYNVVRPHEAIDMNPPAVRYQISCRAFPETIKSPEYNSMDIVRSVRDGGRIRYKGKEHKISEAFKGHQVALRPTERDGVLAIYYYRHKVGEINV